MNSSSNWLVGSNNFSIQTTFLKTKQERNTIMYSLQVKSTFIEFRSMGFTIDDISEKTGVHRTTLLQWNKDLYAEIKIAEQNQLDRI